MDADKVDEECEGLPPSTSSAAGEAASPVNEPSRATANSDGHEDHDTRTGHPKVDETAPQSQGKRRNDGHVPGPATPEEVPRQSHNEAPKDQSCEAPSGSGHDAGADTMPERHEASDRSVFWTKWNAILALAGTVVTAGSLVIGFQQLKHADETTGLPAFAGEVRHFHLDDRVQAPSSAERLAGFLRRNNGQVVRLDVAFALSPRPNAAHRPVPGEVGLRQTANSVLLTILTGDDASLTGGRDAQCGEKGPTDSCTGDTYTLQGPSQDYSLTFHHGSQHLSGYFQVEMQTMHFGNRYWRLVARPALTSASLG